MFSLPLTFLNVNMSPIKKVAGPRVSTIAKIQL